LCGNFILPEPASYVFFYAVFNLRKLLYIIQCRDPLAKASVANDLTRCRDLPYRLFEKMTLEESYDI